METIQGSLSSIEPQQPETFAIDATKCQSLEEVGLLLNALGFAVTKEFAETYKLEHLLVESK